MAFVSEVRGLAGCRLTTHFGMFLVYRFAVKWQEISAVNKPLFPRVANLLKEAIAHMSSKPLHDCGCYLCIAGRHKAWAVVFTQQYVFIDNKDVSYLCSPRIVVKFSVTPVPVVKLLLEEYGFVVRDLMTTGEKEGLIEQGNDPLRLNLQVDGQSSAGSYASQDLKFCGDEHEALQLN